MCLVGDLLGHLRKACDAFVFSSSVCESMDMQTRLSLEVLLGRIREACPGWGGEALLKEKKMLERH